MQWGDTRWNYRALGGFVRFGGIEAVQGGGGCGIAECVEQKQLLGRLQFSKGHETREAGTGCPRSDESTTCTGLLHDIVS